MNRLLYGGAMAVPIAASFIDASQLRQIPDNQEVFVDMSTQQSMVFELLEEVEAAGEECARYHFEQLASDNDAHNPKITHIHTLDVQQTSPLLSHHVVEIYLLQGTQDITKFNENNAFNTVDIMLAIVRLKEVNTDFIISINAPSRLSSTSSEQESVNQTHSVDMHTVKMEMENILKGLVINDWSLFG